MPNDRGLVFYDKSHRYKLDGEWVPGVTTILNVLAKPALVAWSAGLVADFVASEPSLVDLMAEKGGRDPLRDFLKAIPNQRRDTAADRGTKFHDFAERIAKGEEVEVPAQQVGMVESALAFMDDWGIRPVLVEEAVASREHKWAGKLDLVADHKNGPRAIFDWKSGKRIYTSAVFQLNAYAHAEFYGQRGVETNLDSTNIKEAYGVHIRDDGYDVYPLAFGPEVYDEFLCIRRAYDINKRAEGDWKVPGSGYVGAKLREPFPKSAIGRLPKGGVMLDYVGHAATTDRLLAVDPDWTWEPFAVDASGLPATANGNLWIKLTVCGVTRIGVGDGKSLKEAIGDAIRNAAMRFGVALDLWAKEDLDAIRAGVDVETGELPPAESAPATRTMSRAQHSAARGTEGDPDEDRPADAITKAQLTKLHATFNDLNITDRAERLAIVAEHLGRPIDSSNDLSRTEASRLIDYLDRGQAA
jgi:hypothetical protein